MTRPLRYKPERELIATSLAVAWREWRIVRSYRTALLGDVLAGLSQLVIYFYLSRTFVDQPVRALNGAPDYFSFVAVGVAITGVIAATGVSVAQRVREEQVTGTLELLVAQPIGVLPLSVGYVGFPFLLALVRAAAYFLLGSAVFGISLDKADWLGAAIVMAATSAALIGIGIALGALTLLIKRTSGLVGLVLITAGIMGGAYFPLSVLPDWIEMIANVFPTTLAFDGLRAALFRGSGWGADALGLLAFAAVALPLSVYGFGVALRATIRRGTLSEY